MTGGGKDSPGRTYFLKNAESAVIGAVIGAIGGSAISAYNQVRQAKKEKI